MWSTWTPAWLSLKNEIAGAQAGAGGCCAAVRRSGGNRDRLLDRHADHAAPLGPAAVVVADALVAEELVEHEPAVGAALADPAVGDHVLVGGDALRLVQIGQL